MKSYVINYIEKTSNQCNIEVSDFYNLINNEWQKHYGDNLKRISERHGYNMIDYCHEKDKNDYSFLLGLVHLSNVIKKKYFNK